MKNTLKAVVAVAGVLVASLGFAGVLVINVPAGETQDFYTAVEANGYTRETFKDHPILTKTGTGTLISTNDLASKDSGYYFQYLRVNEGVFVARCKADLGVNPMAGGAIDVLNGATLRFEGASGTEMLNNWCVDLKGTGASGEGGAIRCVGPTGVSYAQYRLLGDATFATSYADGYTMCFMAGLYGGTAVSKINLNGYNATLKAVGSGKGFCLSGSGFRLDGTGQLIVDGTEFLQDNESLANKTVTDGTTTLVLKNGATFGPKTQVMVSFFDNIDISSDSVIRGRGTSAFDMTIGGWAGAGTIDGGISSLTIADSLTVRTADLIAGKRLELPGPITFGEGVTLKIEGSFSSLNPGQDGRVKFVASEDGITGCPTLVTQLGRHWTFEKAADGKSLDLVYDPALPEGVIDVRTWGVLPGVDAAANNATAFADGLAALPAGRQVVYFSAGDYYFDEALDIARDDTVLTGEGRDAKLHLTEGAQASSLVNVSGRNVSITGLVIADTTGPGVFISGAENCAVTNAFFSGVKGTYPVEAENSTLTCVRDNRFLDGATYAALAHHTGGSAAIESEPLPQYITKNNRKINQFRLTVDAGESETVSEAFAICGLASMKDLHLTKVGPGTLVGETSNNFKGASIEEGVYEAASSSCFGIGDFGEYDYFAVEPGGTLRITCVSGRGVANRVIYLSGAGAPGQGGALVWADAGGAWYPQYHLSGDAVMATEYAGDFAKALTTDNSANPPVVNLHGYDLKLVATGSGKGFLVASVLNIYGPGSLTVDGTTVKQSAAALVPKVSTSLAALRLRNGATFSAYTADSFAFFSDVDCDAGSSIVGTGAAFGLEFASWTGAGTVDAGIASLALSSLAVRAADLNAGQPLAVAGTLAFAANSPLSVDDGTALVAGGDGRVTFAASATAMTGLPTLVGGKKVRNWTVEAGEDGKSGKLLYVSSKPEGAIDVAAEWGIQKGLENAEGNAAKFNDGVAALTGPAVLFFPMGDFYFDAPLAIAKDGVTLVGDLCDSVLKAGEGFVADSLLEVSGANVTVSGLTLGNVTGPAVVANGTTAFVATNNDFIAVGGAIEGVEGTYPVEVINGTGTFVRDNLILGGTKYTAAVYLDGGTKHADGEPLTGLVRIRVDAGEELGLEDAFARTGRAEYPQDARLVKTGGGKILSSGAYGSLIKGITIEAGVYALTGDHAGQAKFGAGDQIYILSGGTLLFAGDVSYYLNNKIVFVEGTGAPGMGGAVVNEGCGICRYAQYRLTGDATFATAYAGGYAQCFNRLPNDMVHPSNFSMNGHVLTLTATGFGKGYQLTDQFQFNDATGTVIVDGTTLAQGSATVVPFASKTAKLVLRNGAKFLPRSQDILGLFSSIAADETSSVIGGDGGSAAFDLTVGGWSGAGTVGTGISSLAVTNSFEVNAADILAGDHMTAACPVTLSAGVRMRVRDPDGLFAAMERKSVRYDCAESAVSFTGLPRKDGTSDFKSWKPVLANGTTLCIDTYLGALLFIR